MLKTLFIRNLRIFAGAYLSEAPLGAPLWGRLLALPANFRLGWKSLQGTNTLAYYEKA
jgi:hypothetical protein